MNKPIVAIYFEKHDVGLVIFQPLKPKVSIGQLLWVTPHQHELLKSVLMNTECILSNQPQNQIVTRFQVLPVGMKSLFNEMIEQSLDMVPSHDKHRKSALVSELRLKPLKMKALGMLLHHLQEATHYISSSKLLLEDIEYHIDSVFRTVAVDQKELQYLEIKVEEVHPCLVKGKGKSKEGYSVLNIYESYLSTRSSKKILRRLFLNPTWHKPELETRYNIIEWMKHEMKDKEKYGKIFRHLHCMETTLKKFTQMNTEEDDWKKLVKTLETMSNLRKMLPCLHMPGIVKEYVENPGWGSICEMLVVIKQTLEFNPFAVRAGVDHSLDRLKRTYDQMPHLLTMYAQEQSWDIDFRIVFMAQIGYLVKITHDTSVESDPQEWILQFSNHSGRYYSNPLTQKLDQQYGDIYGELHDRQQKMIFEMQALVAEKEYLILSLYWQCCRIECFWGISQISRNMCRPKLSSQELVVVNGWHLLLAQEAIDNHCFSFNHELGPTSQVYDTERNLVNTKYSNRCMIISGPNGSGKTIYAKQLGILVYLAHVGLYLPAQMAEIPLVDRILSVESCRSIYQRQGGLKSELGALSRALCQNLVTNKSLVLIDEIGSSADYSISIKLLYTIIQSFIQEAGQGFPRNSYLSCGSDRFSMPLCVIITHLTELIMSEFLREGQFLRYLTMQMEKEATFMYKITPGLVKKGYGIQAASSIMPKEFITRAETHWKKIKGTL